MSDAPVAPAKDRIRALRRRRMRLNDARTRLINLRCSESEREAIKNAALRAGLSVGAFLRALALGDPGPRAVRRPPVERVELARLLGHLGKIGSNINQIAKAIHTTCAFPTWPELACIRDDIATMRAALLAALGRDH
jgi:hypothetical protein